MPHHTLMTTPCVSTTMMPRMTMNATDVATSRRVSRFSASLFCGGRKNSAGRSFILLRATTPPFGSRKGWAFGAGQSAQHHEWDDQKDEEGDLEDDEPSAQSHEFEAPSRNRDLVIEVVVELLLLGQRSLLGGNGCPAETFGAARRTQRGLRDGETIQSAETLEMIEAANRWFTGPVGD